MARAGKGRQDDKESVALSKAVRRPPWRRRHRIRRPHKESVCGIIARRIAHNDNAVSDVDREFCHNSWYEDIFTNSYVLMTS